MRNSQSENPADSPVTLLEFGFESEAWLARARRSAEADPLGRIGDYVVLDVAGRGGQATVYCCQRVGDGPVALKRIHGGAAASRQARERMARELACTAKLDHPNIVAARPVEVGSELLLEMDWVDGVPLSQWAGPSGNGRRPTADLLALFEQICAAVQHAHAHAVLHCDLKPTNILVDRAGRPRILDFGIARPLAEFSGTTTLTVTESVLGTPAYASPEQVNGEVADLDARSDVYSLGVLMYEAFAGASPYPQKLSLGRLLCAIEDWEPPRLRALNRHVPRGVEAVILRALQKDPRRRYATVAHLHEDIVRCQRGERPESARDPVIRAGLRRFGKRRPVLAWLGICFAAAGVVLGTWWYLNWRLDRSGEAYLNEVLPIITSRWDPQEYLQRCSSEAREAIPDESVIAHFANFAERMGPLVQPIESVGDAQFVLWPTKPYRALAEWKTRVQCTKGKCVLETYMLRRGGRWWFTCLTVTPENTIPASPQPPFKAPAAP